MFGKIDLPTVYHPGILKLCMQAAGDAEVTLTKRFDGFVVSCGERRVVIPYETLGDGQTVTRLVVDAVRQVTERFTV